VSLTDLQQKQEAYLELKATRQKTSKAVTEAEPIYTQKVPEPVSQPEPSPQKEKSVSGSTDKVMEKPPKTAAPVKTEPKKITGPSPYDQALALYTGKKYEQAIPLFEAAQKENPLDKDLNTHLFESYFQLGLAQFNAEKYLPAKKSFQSAFSQDSSCEKCPDYIKKCEDTYKEKHYNLGIHYFGKEQLKEAIEEWERVKAIDPGYKELGPNLKKAELLYERLESIKKANQ